MTLRITASHVWLGNLLQLTCMARCSPMHIYYTDTAQAEIDLSTALQVYPDRLSMMTKCRCRTGTSAENPPACASQASRGLRYAFWSASDAHAVL